MSAALKTVEILGPEARAFITGGTPKPQFDYPQEAETAPKSQMPRTEVPVANVEHLPDNPKINRSRSVPIKEEAAVVPGMVSLNSRIPAEIHQALLTASFKRKLLRKEPWTQQDIATEALSTWLKREGYL